MLLRANDGLLDEGVGSGALLVKTSEDKLGCAARIVLCQRVAPEEAASPLMRNEVEASDSILTVAPPVELGSKVPPTALSRTPAPVVDFIVARSTSLRAPEPSSEEVPEISTLLHDNCSIGGS
jgi:hypothetical protein